MTNVLFFINILNSLSIKKIECKLSHMYRFEIFTTGIIEYSSLIQKYNLKYDRKNIFGPITNEEGDLDGLLLVSECGKKPGSRVLFFDNEIFSKDNKKFPQSNFNLSIDQYSNLIFALPELILNENIKDGHKLTIEASQLCSTIFIDRYLNPFLKKCVNEKIWIINNCAKLCLYLSSREELGIFDLLERGDYILLYFKREYVEMMNFFSELIQVLTDTENITEEQIKHFLLRTVDNYLLYEVDADWSKYFETTTLDESETIENIILTFLLTDIHNLFEILNDPEWKFRISEVNRNREKLIGRTTLLFEINIEDIANEYCSDVSVRDENNYEIEYLHIATFEETLYVFFDKLKLIKRGVKSLSFNIITPNIAYETEKIKL